MLSRNEMRQLLNSIDTGELIGLRARVLLGLMSYTFALVSAVITLRVEDYFQQGRRIMGEAPRERRKTARGSLPAC